MDKSYKVVVGSDDAGIEYREILKEVLKNHQNVSEVIDIGVQKNESTAYPNVAFHGAELIAKGSADRALLICGTGLGMAISANKVAGIRAGTAHDSYSVERLVLSNNAQILTMGQRVIGIELAKRLVDEWMNCEFDEKSASAQKVAEIISFENSKKDIK